jgi:hypothetical protein
LSSPATDDRAVNAAVSAAANAARIPCNVVDDRELSSFIMPAIIDRSPVQIAISTGGTSPVLARLIRERLETLLDSSLGPLAAFADRWRTAIRAKFADLGARRRFLSWMLTGPVAAALRADRTAQAEALTRKALDDADALPTGHVVLVGAGPGNSGLMTLQGLRALQEAMSSCTTGSCPPKSWISRAATPRASTSASSSAVAARRRKRSTSCSSSTRSVASTSCGSRAAIPSCSGAEERRSIACAPVAFRTK